MAPMVGAGQQKIQVLGAAVAVAVHCTVSQQPLVPNSTVFRRHWARYLRRLTRWQQMTLPRKNQMDRRAPKLLRLKNPRGQQTRHLRLRMTQPPRMRKQRKEIDSE